MLQGRLVRNDRKAPPNQGGTYAAYLVLLNPINCETFCLNHNINEKGEV